MVGRSELARLRTIAGAALLILTAATPAVASRLVEETLRAANRQRLPQGEEPLAASDALARAAGRKAAQLAAEAETFPSLRPEHVTALAQLDDLPELLAAEEYEPRRARAHVVVADRPLRADDLFDHEPSLRADLLDGELLDVGLAVARSGGLEILVAVVALSKRDDFAARTAGLANLTATRSDLLSLTNQARKRERRAPLRADRCLRKAAQLYAERMLEEGFYGHQDPEGYDVAFRVRAAGCRSRHLAENLARGQTTPGQVVDGWLESPGHRENLVNPAFRRVGFGLAVARRDGEGWIVWVQILGAD